MAPSLLETDLIIELTLENYCKLLKWKIGVFVIGICRITIVNMMISEKLIKIHTQYIFNSQLNR